MPSHRNKAPGVRGTCRLRNVVYDGTTKQFTHYADHASSFSESVQIGPYPYQLVTLHTKPLESDEGQSSSSECSVQVTRRAILVELYPEHILNPYHFFADMASRAFHVMTYFVDSAFPDTEIWVSFVNTTSVCASKDCGQRSLVLQYIQDPAETARTIGLFRFLETMSDHPVRFLDSYRNEKVCFSDVILGFADGKEDTNELRDWSAHRLGLNTTWWPSSSRWAKGRPFMLPGGSLFPQHLVDVMAPVYARRAFHAVQPRILMILRGTIPGKIVNGRRLMNYANILDALQKEHGSVNTVDLDSVRDIRAQLDIFDQYDVVIGVHGAALMLAMFMRPGGELIEILPHYCFDRVVKYHVSAERASCEYSLYLVDPKSSRQQGAAFEPDTALGTCSVDITVNVTDFTEVVARAVHRWKTGVKW
jgi:hypothetical protein